jgi:precorrin-2 dehydrogenase/sirohydrochlorin ferrochelatase
MIKIWCNQADDAETSDFHLGAAVRRGEICIGITTGGGSPALSKHLKKEIESAVGDEYAQLLKSMSRRRDLLKTKVKGQANRSQIWQAVLAGGALEAFRAGEAARAEKLIDDLISGSLDL